MKAGLLLGYWGQGPPEDMQSSVRLAGELNLDSIWTAEAYGSDALTPLAWLGAQTPGLRLGTSVLQMSARTPTATAMAAMTMDHLSGGRFVLGLGASGPQVVEGWYGQPYRRPLERTREYIDIVRQVVARERVTYDGAQYSLPLRGGTGLGKPLRSTLHPLRDRIPILLAAEGPKNVALAAEIADGWIAMFYSPFDDAHFRSALDEGFNKRPESRRPEDFEVMTAVSVVIDADVETAADRVRPMLALYIGGMGAREQNYHFQAAARLGYEAECLKIQDLFLGGHKKEACAAVPLGLVEKLALVGPPAKIVDELQGWSESLVSTLLPTGATPEALRLVAESVN